LKTFRLNSGDIRRYAKEMRAGDRVYLSDTIYTARDAAHKKLFELLDRNEPLPFPLKDAVIYYAGPTPAREGEPIGSCGPTTSGRMDKFAPRLYALGLAATIGKGERSEDVARAIAQNEAVYLCAVGGAGALISRHIKAAEDIAFPELGCEAIRRMTVEDLPLIVALDCAGGDIFRQGRTQYAER
jgi:fumarate hydratase subunit beta